MTQIRITARLLTALALAAGAAAESVPGLPPPAAPEVWLEFANDAWGPQLIDNRDDDRTAVVRGGASAGRWRLTIDASMLTAKPLGRRSDELTATVGYDLLPAGGSSALGTSEIVLVGGGRFAGDMGGASLQQRWHAAAGYTFQPLTYDPENLSLDPLLGIAAAHTWRYEQFGLRGITQGLVTGRGEWQGCFGVHLLADVPGAEWWGGSEWHPRGGTTNGPVAASVAQAEQGMWLVSGLQIGFLTTSVGRTFDGDDVQGSLGIASGIASGRTATVPGHWHLALELGTTLSAPGLIQRLLWSHDDFPLAILLDTRASTVPGQVFAHDSVRTRQVSLGPAWTPRWDLGSLRVGPDVDAGIGWRTDGIVAEDNLSQLPELHRHGVAATAGLGIGLDSELDPTTQMGVSGSWDISQPLVHPLMVGEATLLDRSCGWSARVRSAVSW